MYSIFFKMAAELTFNLTQFGHKSSQQIYLVSWYSFDMLWFHFEFIFHSLLLINTIYDTVNMSQIYRLSNLSFPDIDKVNEI